MADKIAVLIPCYNESKTVAKVIRDMKKALPEAVIYVYDNNSTDGTDEIARKEGAVVRYEYQQGKGNVIRSMFRDIDARCYLMVDGDDTYPAEFAAEMCSKVLEKGTDMVVGDRLSSTYFTENKRPFHNFGNSIVRGSINRLFKSNIKDIMTGYRAMSYRFVKTFPVLSRNFEIETEMTIHAIDKNMQVENVVIEYRDRPEGSESKLNTYADGFKVHEDYCENVQKLQAAGVLLPYRSSAVCGGNGILYSGAGTFSGGWDSGKDPDTDRQRVCDSDSYHLLVFRDHPFYTGQSA